MMTSNMTKQEIESELKRLAPFQHKLDLPYGLSTFDPKFFLRHREQTRLDA